MRTLEGDEKWCMELDILGWKCMAKRARECREGNIHELHACESQHNTILGW